MRRRKSSLFTETRKVGINLAPLVDISLSLVVIFIVSLPFILESGIFVSKGAVAKGVKTRSISQTDVKVNLYLRSDGVILLNERPVPLGLLSDILPQLLERSLTKDVILSADSDVVYKSVIEVIDIAKNSGAKDIFILKRRG
jgi:biopolymer transport protein ExbD